MTTNIRIAAHGLLFLLAFVVFYLGLGLDLRGILSWTLSCGLPPGP